MTIIPIINPWAGGSKLYNSLLNRKIKLEVKNHTYSHLDKIIFWGFPTAFKFFIRFHRIIGALNHFFITPLYFIHPVYKNDLYRHFGKADLSEMFCRGLLVRFSIFFTSKRYIPICTSGIIRSPRSFHDLIYGNFSIRISLPWTKTLIADLS